MTKGTQMSTPAPQRNRRRVQWTAVASVVLLLGVPVLATACGSEEDAGATDTSGRGLVSEEATRARQDDYLAFATATRGEGSVLNLMNHLERAERDPSFTPVATDVGPEAFDSSWEKIDGFKDTADFDMLYLLNLWLAHRDAINPSLRARIEEAIVGFKYWYDDPQPAGIADERWYWSENHRMIFHTLEYLTGQEFPDTTFAVTGLTGEAQRERARAKVMSWLEEKARWGFSEWHSDVYYQKDITPLLTLVEFADDPEVANAAATVLDLVLFDLALHTLDGNFGVTHGRSYMKDKSQAVDQDTFAIAKMLFDQTDEPWTGDGDSGASLLARAKKYRLPEVIRVVATDPAAFTDREHMGLPLGLDAELVTWPDSPALPAGAEGAPAFDDPASIPFWWDRGALTAWPVVPITLDTIAEHDLWDTPLFAQFRAIRDVVYDPATDTYDYAAAQRLSYSLRDMINVGLLDEVTTATWRNGDAMLSSALDYRPGAQGNQYHAWQATLGERAIVFTTLPGNEPRKNSDRFADGDMYWTGTGAMPRSAQSGNAAIHIYAPAFASPTDALLKSFDYLPFTHAFFPTEHFDEVVRDGNWTFGRAGDGYVALWSWRTPEWRTPEPDVVNQNDLTGDYDLVAPGGPDNAWIVEVGSAADAGDFASFMASMRAATPQVTRTSGTGPFDDFAVEWTSPTQGRLAFGSKGPFTVNGADVPLHGGNRYENPFAQVPFGAERMTISAGDRRLDLDFTTWRRRAS